MRGTAKAPAGESLPGKSTKLRNRFAIPVLLAAAVAFVMALAAAPAMAADEHYFDPALSLTGGSGDPGSAFAPKPFASPCGTATDPAGDIYVASSPGSSSGTEGRIDVYNPQGEYLAEIADSHQPCSLAVDGAGNVYAVEAGNGKVVRYAPSSYPPASETTYGAPATLYNLTLECAASPASATAVAVDPSNDRPYVALPCKAAEYKSAAEGSELVSSTIGSGLGESYSGIDVYGGDLYTGVQHDVYLSGVKKGGSASSAADSRIFVIDGATGEAAGEMNGEETPAKNLGFKASAGASIAVDQSNGDVYVDAVAGNGTIGQYDWSGIYVGCLGASSEGCVSPPGLEASTLGMGGDVAVDDRCLVESGEEEVKCSGSEAYESPNENFVFATSGSEAGESNLYAYAPTAAEVIESEAIPLLLTKSGAGKGTVTSSPAGINCGESCAKEVGSFEEGAKVKLSASAASGSEFREWTGACEGTGACEVTMSEARAVTARFAHAKQTLTVIQKGTGSGSAASKPKGVKCGATCSLAEAKLYKGTPVLLKVKASTGSSITAFTGCDAASSTPAAEGTCEVTMSAAKTVEVTYGGTAKAITNPKALTLSKGPGTGFGAVKASGLACEEACTQTKASYFGGVGGAKPKAAALVTLKAAPSFGSKFSGWTGCESEPTASECVVSMEEDRSVSATFTALPRRNLYLFKAKGVGTEGTGSVSSKPKGINCSATCAEEVSALPEGAVVVLAAKPSTGSTFVKWKGCDEVNGEGKCVVTMGTSFKSVIAVFGGTSKAVPAKKRLTLEKAGTGQGTVKATGIKCEAACLRSVALYQGPIAVPKPKEAKKVLLTAIPAAGSDFAGWSGACSGASLTCEVQMNEAETVVARFEE